MQYTYYKSSCVNKIDNCIEIYSNKMYLKEIYKMLTLGKSE